MKRLALHTMGCRANQYDSAAIEGMLAQAGWKLVDFNSPAEAYLLNTCTVTNKADAEARSLIRKAYRQNPEASILVTGCYAQTNPKALAGVEGVSFILGNNQKGNLLSYLEKAKPIVPEVVVEDLFKEEAIFTSNFASHTDRSRAYVKIQDGCNQMCSYCVIPFARGKNRSLSEDKVLEELHRLSSEGFSEAVLTGIHIGTYGQDLTPSTSLLHLMKRIERERPIHRVRLSSIDPEEVCEEMIEFLSTSKIFCAYLHIPLQSGEDEILKLMRRKYTAQDFEKLACRLKEKNPDICLGTDVMVGFPYEDDQRFEKSYQLAEKTPLDYLHVFPYSAKIKTRAASFLGQVPTAVKRKRVERLTRLSREKREFFYKKALGRRVEVVLEENASDTVSGFVKGMSRNYLPVYVPLPSNFSQEEGGGSLKNVLVTSFEGGNLFGEIDER